MDDGTERLLSLHEAAERLGVHYMTAYRYIRTGRLAARKESGEWRVAPADLEGPAAALLLPDDGGHRGGPAWSRHAARLFGRLVAGDEQGAWQVAQSVLGNGADPTSLYVRALAPALRQVGDRWAAQALSIGDEHRATAVAHRLVGRLGPLFNRPGRRRGTVVLGAAPGDLHGLPVALLADVLRARNFAIVDLGAATPVESFVAAVAAHDAVVAVGVTVGASGAAPAASAVVDAIGAAHPAVPVLVGGPAVRDGATAAALGAAGWSADAVGAAVLVEDCARRR
jgi:excisionase family DNA binding protein